MASQNLPEGIMEQVLCGERPADDPEFAQLLERDSELRARWERIRALTESLDAMGETERAVLTGSPAADPDREERVARMVRDHFRPARRFNGVSPRWLLGVLTAAALVLVVWTLGGRGGTGDVELVPSLERVVLGEGDTIFSEMTSTALGDGSYRLGWVDAERAFGRTYVVRVFERDGAALEALTSEELLSPPWTLYVPAGRDPAHLAWSVDARDADGNQVATSAVRSLGSP